MRKKRNKNEFQKIIYNKKINNLKMDVLRKYNHFINEAVDNDKDVKSMNDVPDEVIAIARKIATDMYDRVGRPTFEFRQGEGVLMRFFVTEQDFRFIDENENLTLDMAEGARMKRGYDVILIYNDRISETFELQYIVTFEKNEHNPIIVDDDEDDVIIDNDYYKQDPDDVFFDDDEAHRDIMRGKYKIKDEEFDDIDDDDDF